MRKSIVLIAAALFTAATTVGLSDAVAKPKVSNISVTKTTDKASPNLLRANTAPRDVATGQASGKRQHTPIR